MQTALIFLRPRDGQFDFAGFISPASEKEKKSALAAGLICVELGSDEPIPPIYQVHVSTPQEG